MSITNKKLLQNIHIIFFNYLAKRITAIKSCFLQFSTKKQPENLFLFYIFLVFLNISIIPLVFDDVNRSNIAALYNHTIIKNLIFDYQNWTGRMSAQWQVYFGFFKKNIFVMHLQKIIFL